MCNAGHTVDPHEPFAMMRNKRNGLTDEGVCDVQHTVHSDELFVIRQHKNKVSQIKVCAMYNIRFTRMNCL